MRSRSGAVAALLALTLVGCADEPGGPGTLVAYVTGSSLGGVVLEVTGRGIRGFEGLANTRVYAAPVLGDADTHRVMLIDPDGGQLRFEIQVDDIDMEPPVLHIVSAADVGNRTQLVAGIETTIER